MRRLGVLADRLGVVAEQRRFTRTQSSPTTPAAMKTGSGIPRNFVRLMSKNACGMPARRQYRSCRGSETDDQGPGAQRRHERVHAGLGDDQPVDEPDQSTDDERCEDGEHQRHALLDQEAGHKDPAKLAT